MGALGPTLEGTVAAVASLFALAQVAEAAMADATQNVKAIRHWLPPKRKTVKAARAVVQAHAAAAAAARALQEAMTAAATLATARAGDSLTLSAMARMTTTTTRVTTLADQVVQHSRVAGSRFARYLNASDLA